MDQNAVLIAESLEAAGDGHATYGWYMWAAALTTHHYIMAAQISWDRG
ncbi:hypothetical protein [Mycobacterium uberis]|nr:hypothetical protein [Mycobacterium uberis]